jgi:hypothetical protein
LVITLAVGSMRLAGMMLPGNGVREMISAPAALVAQWALVKRPQVVSVS